MVFWEVPLSNLLDPSEVVQIVPRGKKNKAVLCIRSLSFNILVPSIYSFFFGSFSLVFISTRSARPKGHSVMVDCRLVRSVVTGTGSGSPGRARRDGNYCCCPRGSKCLAYSVGDPEVEVAVCNPAEDFAETSASELVVVEEETMEIGMSKSMGCKALRWRLLVSNGSSLGRDYRDSGRALFRYLLRYHTWTALADDMEVTAAEICDPTDRWTESASMVDLGVHPAT